MTVTKKKPKKAKSPRLVEVPIEDLILIPELQMRAATLLESHVEDLRKALRAGVKLKARYRDVPEKGKVVVDGWHTIHAYFLEKKKTVPCLGSPGTWLDAVIESSAANQHLEAPLKRTYEDKRRAVRRLSEELKTAGQKWSNRKIADTVGVTHTFVNELLKVEDLPPEPSKNGKPNHSQSEAASVDVDHADAEETPETFSLAEAVPVANVDAWGIPIQEHAKSAFECVPAFDELLSTIRSAMWQFNELANKDGGRLLTRQEVSTYKRGKKDEQGNDTSRFVHPGLERALAEVQAMKPTHTVCPYAYGDKEHVTEGDNRCSCCFGLNWTGELAESSIPKMCVSRAKKALIPQER